ncbi:hypothetical protein J6590_077161 [Homalodisca vitripennis]|nr:hypothetical protein J6590_077161 [Homalodisca vitripennis]
MRRKVQRPSNPSVHLRFQTCSLHPDSSQGILSTPLGSLPKDGLSLDEVPASEEGKPKNTVLEVAGVIKPETDGSAGVKEEI